MYYLKKYEEVQHLIERANKLIRLQATGTSYEFAEKLGISRKTLFRLLKYLKSTNAPIKYCKYRRAYYFE
jgi:DNA-binding CsgD family transcriptional regulator